MTVRHYYCWSKTAVDATGVSAVDGEVALHGLEDQCYLLEVRPPPEREDLRPLWREGWRAGSGVVWLRRARMIRGVP